MDQQLVALLTEYILTMSCAVAASFAICFAYWNAVGPLKRVAWLPPVIILLAVTTALVISIIKTSVALSLGLIGALSVARFRSSINDPRQLALIFVAIAIGIGCGAGELLLTGIGTVFIAGLIAFFYRAAFLEPTSAAPLRITARLSFRGNSPTDVGLITDYLQRRQIAHRIKGTARKANVTSVTVQFFNCSVTKADRIVNELAYVLAACDFESDLQVKSVAGAEASDMGGTETVVPGRRTAPRRSAKPHLRPSSARPSTEWGGDLERPHTNDLVDVRPVKGLLVDRSK